MIVRIPKQAEKQALKSAPRPTSAFMKTLVANHFFRLSDPKIITKVENCLPTGVPALDVISARDVDGRWGMPFGRQIEFSGNPDSGKTTMLIMIAASAQRAGHDVIWIETEHSLNGSRADNLGIDLDKLWVTFPDYLEQGAERIEEAVNSMPKRGEKSYNKNKGLVICFDSIAATPTEAEYKGKLTDTQVAEFARMMFKFQRRMNGRITKRNVMVIYSNQLKAKIGVMFGKKTTTYGGNAIRYHASLRFECVYTGRLKGAGGVVNGITMKVDNQKNKCFMPYKKIDGLEFSFENGFNYAHCLLLALAEKGLAKKVGPRYTIFPLGKDVKMMKSEFAKKLDSTPGLAARLREVVNAAI